MRYFFFSALFFFCTLFQTSYLAEAGSRIPSSDKSQDVYRRVAPKLIREMKKIDANLGDPAFIRIFKKEKKLEVWLRQGLTYILFKSYSICHHSGDLGPKIREGDKQSPEGFYTVGASQLNPNSDYHLSFNLGFPNEYDRSRKRTGSLLMVHGRCSSVGCFAMADFRMDEIYAIVESAIISGQHQVPVHIFPFRMTTTNMTANSSSKWLPFWKNLKEGYDYFEGHHAPPLVTVQNKRYRFITFRPLLFGGNLPDVGPNLKYAGLKKKREQERRKAQWIAKKQQREQRVAEAKKSQRKKERLYIANSTRSHSSDSAPLLLGD
jgi:murein L,D-transpeptidase YafK